MYRYINKIDSDKLSSFFLLHMIYRLNIILNDSKQSCLEMTRISTIKINSTDN